MAGGTLHIQYLFIESLLCANIVLDFGKSAIYKTDIDFTSNYTMD